ncbi:MAG TPA: hypothetical protein ENJ35_01220 [Gammaproteobacteria bacterium]|nr:hypothetical protein [Gammaproteobacteria bacterium]
MARIPDDELDRLKQAVSLTRLAQERGLKLKRRVADLIGLCPCSTTIANPVWRPDHKRTCDTAWGRARLVAASSTG